MAPDKLQALSNVKTRQKVVGGILVLVLLIFLWVMFGRSSTSPSEPAPVTRTVANKPESPGTSSIGMVTPKPAELPQTVPLSDREIQLVQLQQQTQAKYLDALNELQVLKVTRDIANANKDISKAKLDTVVSEKQIVEMLTPPAPPPIMPSSLIKPVSSAPGQSGDEQNVSYTVVSVSQLQYRWGAVLGFKGNLYNVHIGDVLPPDGSTVSAISKNGVTLQKDGIKKLVSLVPII